MNKETIESRLEKYLTPETTIIASNIKHTMWDKAETIWGVWLDPGGINLNLQNYTISLSLYDDEANLPAPYSVFAIKGINETTDINLLASKLISHVPLTRRHGFTFLMSPKLIKWFVNSNDLSFLWRDPIHSFLPTINLACHPIMMFD